jgi:uncharacterized protein YbjT (DUF2867 family)
MTPLNRILVVGSTGLLGSEIVRLLRESGDVVRAMVRATSSPEKRAQIESWGAEIVEADLKDTRSLDAACKDVTTVISAATATMSRQPGDSIQSVDEDGQLALVEAAMRAAVKHFVFVSFPPDEVDYALQRAKRKVERRIIESGMTYTILHPANFMEVWFSPALGFDPAHGKARVLGSGSKPVSWISLHDVTRFAVAAAFPGKMTNKIVELAGPEALSALQVIEIFKETSGKAIEVEFLPESTLEAELEASNDSLAEAFAAIMLGVARGQALDPTNALDLLPGRLRSVREYMSQIAKSPVGSDARN